MRENAINKKSFCFETFGTALNPTISLIYNVMGQVVFHSLSSNNYPLADNDDTDTDNKDICETVVILLLLTLSSSIVVALYCCCQYLLLIYDYNAISSSFLVLLFYLPFYSKYY